MPKLTVTPLDPSGSAMPGASVTVYVEPTDLTQEPSVLADLFQDVRLTNAARNPFSIPSNGTAEVYARSFQFFAVKVDRAGYGTRWFRNVEMIGTTPIGG